MKKFFCSLCVVAHLQLISCKEREESGASVRNFGSGNNDLPEEFLTPMQIQEIGGEYGAGSSVKINLNPKRELDQVTMIYSGRYSLVQYDSSGKPIQNDEGEPFYRDGMYAYGYIVDGDGNQEEVAHKKFVDFNETDNWHDLSGKKGHTLIVQFRHGAAFENNSDVIAAQRAVRFTRAIIRYKDAPGQQFEDVIYNKDYDDELSPHAVRVGSCMSHSIFVPKDRRIYRVDVRWGDAKPRQNGVYVAGQAHGYLTINGVAQGEWRNVAAIETQTWAPVTTKQTENPTNQVTLQFRYDNARIHSIRYYYR